MAEVGNNAAATGPGKKNSTISGRVVKTMWLFSWVQLVGIACSVVRTKLVAIWIGATGIGILGLFNTALDTIVTLTQLGLRESSVRNIASAKDGWQLSRIVTVVRRWAWMLGIAGAFLTLILSPWLSELTFGTQRYAICFIILSAAVLLAAVTNGELAVMQGVGKLNFIARASVFGMLGGLLVSIPILYYLGDDGIVWSILAYFVCQAVAVLIMRTTSAVSKPPESELSATPSLRDTFKEGKEFITLGIYMTISIFIAMAVNYIFLAYLNHEEGMEQVGQYQAGYTIVSKYMGLIFTAIGMEFFPRLSKVQQSVRRCSTFVSHEIMIALIVILPGATAMMALDDVIIRLLYSDEFLPTAGYLNFALAGTAFRAVSWCMAYTLLARGDGKVYLLTESISGIAFLILSWGGNCLGGLTGLGVAYALWYVLYTVITGVVYFRRYRMRIDSGVLKLFAVVGMLTVAGAVARVEGIRWIPLAIAVISGFFAIREIRKIFIKR